MVDSLSNGTIGYVHVKAMDSESFRTVFSQLLSDSMRQKKAVIVDERHNGGGWLHDDLCTLLSGKQYSQIAPMALCGFLSVYGGLVPLGFSHSNSTVIRI